MNARDDLTCFAFIFDSDTIFAMEAIDGVAIERKALNNINQGNEKDAFHQRCWTQDKIGRTN